MTDPDQEIRIKENLHAEIGVQEAEMIRNRGKATREGINRLSVIAQGSPSVVLFYGCIF